MVQLLPVFLSAIVYEKESKIKEMMTMMGLNLTVYVQLQFLCYSHNIYSYWVVHYIFDFLLYFGVMMFLIIAGLIFQVKFFLHHHHHQC